MKRGGRVELGVLAGVLLSVSTSVMAATPAGGDTPYNAIIERNVFNLHAPPPPINPADLIKETPPPKITLTGITTILGQKKTFLTIPPTKPGAPPESMMLAEGQAQNEVEVKRIDEKAGVVEVMNHGRAQTLDFDHDGVKPTGAPPGGAPQTMAMPTPSPAQNMTPMPPPANVIRPLRSLAPRPGSSPVSDNNGNAGFGGVNGSGNVSAQPQQSPLTPEEQVALIEIQRIKYRQEGNPISKIFPTTQLTPEVNGDQAPQ